MNHPLSIKARGLCMAVFAILLLPGCVVQRGIDFGHWAQTGQKIPLTRFIIPAQPQSRTPLTKIALLPTIGKLPSSSLETIDTHMLQEAQLAFQTPVIMIDRNGKMAQYVTLKNLIPMGDIWNNREIARLGQLMGVSHVLCWRVRNWRQYQPQNMIIDFILVETTYGAMEMEMLAAFDAREQQVIIALDQYLRNRSARKYDRQNLDIILRSPKEYCGFIATECMWGMSEKLWPTRLPLKSNATPSDSINTAN